MCDKDRLQTSRDKRYNRRIREDFYIEGERATRRRYYHAMKESDPDKHSKMLDHISFKCRLKNSIKKSDPNEHAQLVQQNKLDSKKKIIN